MRYGVDLSSAPAPLGDTRGPAVQTADRWTGIGMTTLRLYSEHFGPLGTSQAKGVLNPLGRPTIGPPYGNDSRIGAEQLGCADQQPGRRIRISWRCGLCTTLPWKSCGNPSSGSCLDLEAPKNLSLGSVLWGTEPVSILAVSDLGTRGLGWIHTRGRPFSGERSTRFRGLLRNVGDPPDRTGSQAARTVTARPPCTSRAVRGPSRFIRGARSPRS